MKTILVTGGNRGIGLEICRQLDRLGHTVILGSRDPGNGKAAAAELSSGVVVRQLDVTDLESIRTLSDSVHAEFGKLDVLINNAGITTKGKVDEDLSLEAAHRVMETNFYGPWRMIKAFLPLLLKSGEGRIINMSSGMGEMKRLSGRWAAYSLSKSSLNNLTVMYANDLKDQGIRVNSMCPGWVRTDMGGPEAPRDVSQGADTAVWLATEKEIPTGKFFRDRKEIAW